MIASFPAFTQTDTTRLVPVKAYKLGYLIRDASLLRICDSLANAQTESIKAKILLNANLEKQIVSLKKENGKLWKADSVSDVRFKNAQELYTIDKENLKTKVKRRNKTIIGMAGTIAVLLAVILGG